MNIFKRIKKIFKKVGWSDITLEKFYKIQELVEQPDEYTENNIRDIVYGIDSASMSLTELANYSIDFLQTPIKNKNVKLQDTYVLNGREYESNINLTMIRTNQFIDFTNYSKEDNVSYEKLLSVFMVPKGHQYNDGYDMREVWDDLKQLDIVTVQSLSFFMIQQFRAFAAIFQRYLVTTAEKMPKEIKLPMEKAAAIIQDLVSFPL